MAKKKQFASTEDNLKSYFAQIKKAKLLTFEEELDLSRRVEAGDDRARKILVEANLRLVVRIAKRYVTPEVAILDLIQEGNLGLMKAATKYDHRKGVRFSTYASWWIKQAVVRSLSNKKRVIRLPHRQEEKLRRINRAYSQLSQRFMREPTTAEIALEIGMDQVEVSSILNASGSVASLDSSGGAESGSLYDMIADEAYDPHQLLAKSDLRADTRRFVDRLLDKERKIILHRYSFLSGRRSTLKTIGDELGISPETVRQIEIRALKKLKLFTDELKEYVYN